MSNYSQTFASREADRAEIARAMRSSDPLVRKNAIQAGERIRRETGEVRAMREALIREHRAGRMDNVKDIQFEVAKKASLQNK